MSDEHAANEQHDRQEQQTPRESATGDQQQATGAEQQVADDQRANDQQSTGQQENEEHSTEQAATGNQQQEEENHDTANSTPPEGTTTPDTLFGSDEMEGLKSEETRKKEEQDKKRKEAANQSGAAKKYPEGTEFRYSGHTKVLPEEMSEAEIFKMVADDFPEIEQGKWSLRYDSAKNRLVPIPPAQKKGAAVDESTAAEPAPYDVLTYEVLTAPPESARPPVYRLLCADGVYEVRSNPSGTYVARLDSELTLAEGYYPSVPKAPASLLGEVVRIFGERPDTEALIDIVYERRAGTFRLVWNQNQASAGEVEYHPLPDNDNLVLYAEIHSHHRMRAFFSPKDGTSEIKTGVYGVVGRIADELPEARFRYSCGGHFRELLAEDLFDDPSTVAATVRRPAI